MKVYVIYETDGYNEQAVDKIFASLRSAIAHVIVSKFSHNSAYASLSQESLDHAALMFISEYEIEP